MRKRYRSMPCICSGCKKESTAKVVNDGIGSYEYWGADFYDNHPILVTTCCDEDALDTETGEILTPEDADKYFQGEDEYYG